MSSPSAVVVPTKGGELVPGAAASATPMKGGMMLSPLPLAGGRRRKSKKLSKKVLKMLKKMTPKQLKKAMKGGEGEEATEAAPEAAPVGARRKTRRSKKSRRSGLLY